MSKISKYRPKLEASLKKLNDVSMEIESVTTEHDLSDLEREVLMSKVDELSRKLKASVKKTPEKFEVEWGDPEPEEKKSRGFEKPSADKENTSSIPS